MINDPDTPIGFYKVKAHICVIGNEFADAIATSCLVNIGRDCSPPWILKLAILFGAIQESMYSRKGMSWNLKWVLSTQEMAHLYVRATNSSCLLCHQPDSQIHMLSGCQNASNQNMVTERHSIASRLIIKTLSKGDFGGNINFHRYWKWNTDGSTKSGLAGTFSQQDSTPMASTKSLSLDLVEASRQTSILLKTRCYLHAASWNKKWPSKRHTGYAPFALGCTPHWSKILWWYTTKAKTSKSNWAAYWIETRPCTAMPQS